ncbi:MAG: hypothetical protein HY752_05665 [Nitrospirae bacterium]|nr:hypothetical protein [Nitrospirota bacterium]
MKSSRRVKSKNHFWFYLLISTAVFMIGAITSYLYFKPKLTLNIPFIKELKSQQLREKHTKGEETTVIPQESFIVFVSAKEAVKKYFEPYGAKVLDLYGDNEDVIHVNISGELRRNFNGDASEEYGIITNLYKTLKEIIPNFTTMMLLIDGKRVEAIGGHIDISEPIDKDISGGDDAQ